MNQIMLRSESHSYGHTQVAGTQDGCDMGSRVVTAISLPPQGIYVIQEPVMYSNIIQTYWVP